MRSEPSPSAECVSDIHRAWKKLSSSGRFTGTCGGYIWASSSHCEGGWEHVALGTWLVSMHGAQRNQTLTLLHNLKQTPSPQVTPAKPNT